MSIKPLKQTKKEDKIFNDILEALNKAKAMQCDYCNRDCDMYSIALGIDYKNTILMSRSCLACLYKIKYGGLNKKDYNFIMNLESIQRHVQWSSELNEMSPKERLKSITHSLKFTKRTLKDLEKEADKNSLKRFIR